MARKIKNTTAMMTIAIVIASATPFKQSPMIFMGGLAKKANTIPPIENKTTKMTTGLKQTQRQSPSKTEAARDDRKDSRDVGFRGIWILAVGSRRRVGRLIR